MDIEESWPLLMRRLKDLLGKEPDLNALLFLIGIQELGQGTRPFSKEEKQDLMHIATCKLLSYDGYYELEGLDAQGWPHWKLVHPVPYLNLQAQETAMRHYILRYFQEEVFPDEIL